jgi:hypothetical protein
MHASAAFFVVYIDVSDLLSVMALSLVSVILVGAHPRLTARVASLLYAGLQSAFTEIQMLRDKRAATAPSAGVAPVTHPPPRRCQRIVRSTS